MAVVIPVTLICYAHGGQSVIGAQHRSPLAVTRMCTGADGLSDVEKVNVKFSPVPGAPPTAEQSETAKATGSYLVRLAPDFFDDWHNADGRRYVLPISGRAEIELAGGQKISLEPGRIWIAEDLTGKGHTFRVLGTEDFVARFVDYPQ